MQHTPSSGARSVCCGDVLVRNGRFGVVWRVDAAASVVVLLPIVRHNIPRHRGDVLLDDMAELMALGCGGRDMMVRAGHPIARRLSDCTYAGCATTRLMDRLGVAMQRAADAARFEAMGTLHNPDLDSVAWI